MAITVSDKIQVNYKVDTDEIAKGYDVPFKSGSTTEWENRVLDTLTTPATDASTSTIKYSIASADLTKVWND